MGAGRRFPELRGGLEVRDEPHEQFVAVIENVASGVRVRLDRKAREIARLLDGTRDAGAISEELRQLGFSVPGALVEKTIDFFDRHGLIDRRDEGGAQEEGKPSPEGQGAPEMREGRFVLRLKPDEIPSKVFFLPEARHGCVGCGGCCHGYTIAPIEPEAAERIRSARFAGSEEWLERTPRLIETERGGLRFLEIEKRDGACIFLEPGNTCLLHRTRGEDFKPAGCRVFPIHFCLLPTGDVLGYLRMECFEYHRARNQGPPLSERMDHIRLLLSLTQDFRVLPKEVKVGPERRLSFQEYMDFETILLEKTVPEKVAPETPAGRKGGSAGGSLEGCLWSIGQAVASLAGGEAVDRIRREGPWSVPEELPERNDALIQGLFSLVLNLGRSVRETAVGPHSDSFARELARAFAAIAEAFAGRGEERDRKAIELVSGPEDDPESREILREALRSEIFSKDWILGGDLSKGYSLMLARNLLIECGARILAARRGAPAASPADTSAAITTVNRSLRHAGARALLSREAALLDEVFQVLGRSRRRPGRSDDRKT